MRKISKICHFTNHPYVFARAQRSQFVSFTQVFFLSARQIFKMRKRVVILHN